MSKLMIALTVILGLSFLGQVPDRVHAQDMKVKPAKRTAFDYTLQSHKAAGNVVEELDVSDMSVFEESEIPKELYPLKAFQIDEGQKGNRDHLEGGVLQFKDSETLKKFLNALSAADIYPNYVLVLGNTAFVSQSSEYEIIPFSKPFSTGGYPELFSAIEKGDLKKVKALQASGLDLKQPRFAMTSTIWPIPGEEFYIDVMHFAEMNALHLAIYYGQIPLVDYLLTQGFSVKDTLSLNGWPSGEDDMNGFWEKVPVLMIPMPSGKELMANHLINKGADVNAQDHTGYPVLFEAASFQRVGFIKVAMEKGADPKVIYKETGEGILHYAEGLETVELLLEAGADAKIVDQDGITVLMYGGGSDLQVAKLLIKAGANPKAIDKEGQNLFFHYVDTALIPFYVKQGVNVNQRNKKGETALFHIWGADTAEALIKAGLDPKIKNNDGKTALEHLVENDGDPEVIEVLRQTMKK